MPDDFKAALRKYAVQAGNYFSIPSDELYVYLDDFTERVKRASSGDVAASRKLLAYLRGCLLSGKAPDPQVASWAAQCLFEVTHHGISADKSFSLVTETGRPSKGGDKLVALLTWESVEIIRATQGLNKTQAIAVYHDERTSLAKHMLEEHREEIPIEAVSTLTRMYRQGAKIVRQYEQETGHKAPTF